jgi:uncharacterized protein YdiU (UPF0061 family)
VASLDSLRFDNRYARLTPPLFARVRPDPLPAPRLVAFNPDAATLLGLDASEASRPDFAEYFGGAKLPPGADPIAMRYAGHQFGVYVPQLGDGRALLLGEVVAPDGRYVDVQLKGSGRTPFSRGGDGRAVLRSTIREYLCSEAMHGLGIPTTRALCIVGSDLPVARARHETAAVLTRLAPSHVRFGSFEMFAHIRKPELVRELAEHVIACHFADADWATRADRHAQLLREVVRRTAQLVAAWQAVGFAHGVMNTDNMSILGLTLDYGPFGFMEAFDPQHICNHTDQQGRYSYANQPQVGHWNCYALGQALLPLIGDVDQAQEALAAYQPEYARAMDEILHAKLGLRTAVDDDRALFDAMFQLMEAGRVDFTRFFRALGNLQADPAGLDAEGAAHPDAPLRDMFLERGAFDAWAMQYRARLRAEPGADADRKAAMDEVNPKYVLRNYLAQVAIDKAQQKDFSEISRLLAVLERPFDEQPDNDAYAALPPDWASHLEVSCSS